MTIAEFHRQLAAGKTAPLDWWKACRERIDAREATLQAWDPLYSRAWTLLGVPCLNMPLYKANGLPVGVQLIVNRFADAKLFAIARSVSD